MANKSTDQNYSKIVPRKISRPDDFGDLSTPTRGGEDNQEEDPDSGDEFQKQQLEARLSRQKHEINIRKVTADFNNFYLEPKKSSLGMDPIPPKDV